MARTPDTGLGVKALLCSGSESVARRRALRLDGQLSARRGATLTVAVVAGAAGGPVLDLAQSALLPAPRRLSAVVTLVLLLLFQVI
jgi:hypothetical protein